MSKKHRQQQAVALMGNTSGNIHTIEYQTIKRDLLKVVILNCIYLLAVLGLYFSNQKTHYLEAWFSKVLKF